MLTLIHCTLSSLPAIHVFLCDAASPSEIREAIEVFASGGCEEGCLLPLVVQTTVYLPKKVAAKVFEVRLLRSSKGLLSKWLPWFLRGRLW